MSTYHVHMARMSPILNESSALEHFKHGNMIKICNGIIFDFCLGLPHILIMVSMQLLWKVHCRGIQYNYAVEDAWSNYLHVMYICSKMLRPTFKQL